jgi:sugar phosphate isomerase/epimerase
MPAAEENGVYVAVEPLCLAIVRSPWLGVNVDPVNRMTLDTIVYMTDAVNEMVELIGERIVAAHAKDGKLEPRVLLHLSECLCETGQMDRRTFLRRFSKLEPWKAVALEHTPDEDVPAAFTHLNECARTDRLAFDSSRR